MISMHTGITQRLGRVLLVLPLLLPGCGSGDSVKRLPVYPVKGTASIDGKPLANMVLQLQPLDSSPSNPKPPVSGPTSSDGSFVLSTYAAGDGAPEGAYEVSLAADAMNPIVLPSIAPLQVDIKKDTKTIEIALKSTKSRMQGAGIPLAQ